MNATTMLNPEAWAEQTFGQVQLHDRRRTRRAVQAACAMVRNASVSLPRQQQSWKGVKALYRLLDKEDVTFDALMQPHHQQTRARMEAERVVLAVQDTTDIDLSHRGKMTGIGQIGNIAGRGLLLQTVLAVEPETKAVLGCLAQKPFVRTPAPKNEQRYQRRHREPRETDVWMHLVEQVGQPSCLPSWWCMSVIEEQICSRSARTCLAMQTHFVVRAAQNRRVQAEEKAIGHLLDQVRTWASQDYQSFEVPAGHGRQARETTLQISFGQVSILPPWNDPRGSTEPLQLWAIRVWEEKAPAGEEALEWILLTSLAIEASDQAWECVHWYRCRGTRRGLSSVPQNGMPH